MPITAGIDVGTGAIKVAPKCPASTLFYSVNGTQTVNGDKSAAGWYVDGTTTHVHY